MIIIMYFKTHEWFVHFPPIQTDIVLVYWYYYLICIWSQCASKSNQNIIWQCTLALHILVSSFAPNYHLLRTVRRSTLMSTLWWAIKKGKPLKQTEATIKTQEFPRSAAKVYSNHPLLLHSRQLPTSKQSLSLWLNNAWRSPDSAT